MKKIISIAAAVFLSAVFICFSAFTAFASPAYVRIKSDPVAVRESAGTSGKYIRSLHSGEYYAYQSQKKVSGGVVWYKIKIGDNRSGWVTSSFATVVDSDNVGRVKVNTALLNVRKGAGYQYGTIGTAEDKTAFDYFDTKKDSDGNMWYRVKYNAEKTGWVVGTYIKVVRKTSGDDSSKTADVKGKQITITQSPVNVRDAAGTGGKKLGTTSKGKTYKILASKKDKKNNVWYQIQYTAKQKGWVMAKFCKIDDTAAKTDDAKTDNVKGQQITITQSPVNVRDAADTGGKKLGTTSKGKTYKILASKKDAKNNVWYQIQYTAKQKGWVMAKFCKIVKDDTAAKTDDTKTDNVKGKKITITQSPVNVRDAAGTSGKKLGATSKGKTYKILASKKDAKNNVWYQIQYTAKQKGWVMARFCKIVK